MNRAYEEIVQFIAAGTTPATVACYEASPAARAYVADLLHKEKVSGLSADEASELEHYLQLEHVMRLAKARARQIQAE